MTGPHPNVVQAAPRSGTSCTTRTWEGGPTKRFAAARVHELLPKVQPPGPSAYFGAVRGHPADRSCGILDRRRPGEGRLGTGGATGAVGLRAPPGARATETRVAGSTSSSPTWSRLPARHEQIAGLFRKKNATFARLFACGGGAGALELGDDILGGSSRTWSAGGRSRILVPTGRPTTIHRSRDGLSVGNLCTRDTRSVRAGARFSGESFIGRRYGAAKSTAARFFFFYRAGPARRTMFSTARRRYGRT